ncbi:alpha/beta fold hydrolase [Jannaschia ovalis]|uniref:Alpha/beta hydrolase n=1 Tax=Jannaschia ovalis TaxID=3038773 RepID=A0ABY8LGB3_9RHOB|nr:alpha/beta hydrolase [Jannaschia sp. GRR-S6-38]WGH79243.1 alpha/beta hydrolase [Jannaschia sp. GRR-S6-38]
MRDVLALHCMLAAGAAWRGVQAALPEARLVCPDLPGHGRAPDWDGGHFMDQALELALAAAPPGALDILGHSYGGCLALRILVERPERVRSLVLVEPVMFAAAPPDLRQAQRAANAPYAAAMAAGDCDGAARAFTGMWGGGPDWDAMPERQRGYIRDRIDLIAASGPGIVEDAHDLLARLPAGPPPVTLVTRTDPPAIVAGIAEGLATRLPGARTARLGRGHMIPMEAPEALAGLIRSA